MVNLGGLGEQQKIKDPGVVKDWNLGRPAAAIIYLASCYALTGNGVSMSYVQVR